jgi:hypothetical protein
VYFSSKVIEDLVIALAARPDLKLGDVQNLIYHLKLPGEEIPRFIASVIAEHPVIGQEQNAFVPRLAFGILDDGLSCFDEDERYRDQNRLCRQVGQIEIGLQRLEHPTHLIEFFERLFSLMVFASNACNDLGTAERALRSVELATLVERVLEAILYQDEETKLVLDAVVRRFRKAERERLRQRVEETISEGIENPPWDDSKDKAPIFDLNGPVRFRLSLYQHDRFPEAAHSTCEYVKQLSRC